MCQSGKTPLPSDAFWLGEGRVDGCDLHVTPSAGWALCIGSGWRWRPQWEEGKGLEGLHQRSHSLK